MDVYVININVNSNFEILIDAAIDVRTRDHDDADDTYMYTRVYVIYCSHDKY